MENAIKKELDYILHKVIDCLGIDELKVEYGDIFEDSILVFMENKIVINNKFYNDFKGSAKCIVHEARHAFQIYYVDLMDDERAKRWERSFSNYIQPTLDKNYDYYALQEVEIDAYASTKFFLQLDGIDVTHKNPDYEEIIDAYLRHNKKFYEECCSIEKG